MIMFNFCSISYRRKRLKQTSPMMKNTRLSITFFATLKRETIQNKNTLFNKKIIFLRVVVVAQLTARSILIREEPGSNPVIGNLNWKTKCWMLVEKSKITKKRGLKLRMSHLQKIILLENVGTAIINSLNPNYKILNLNPELTLNHSIDFVLLFASTYPCSVLIFMLSSAEV